MNESGAASTTDLPLPVVRAVRMNSPFRWLLLGWRDFSRASMLSGIHGVVIALGGLAILGIAWGHFYLLSGAFSGFLLVAPVLATGFYEISRRISRGEVPTKAHVLAAWRMSCTELAAFGLLLAVIGTFWVLISAVLVALFVNVPITGFESFVRNVVLARDSNLFTVWMGMGGLVAALVFAATVIAVPLMLERDVGMLAAMLASIQAVSINPITMAIWAAIIMGLTALGMATMLLGLALIVPVLGHASWHAYLDVVDASQLPERH